MEDIRGKFMILPHFLQEASPTSITSCGSDESLNATSVVDIVAMWYPRLRHTG